MPKISFTLPGGETKRFDSFEPCVQFLHQLAVTDAKVENIGIYSYDYGEETLKSLHGHFESETGLVALRVEAYDKGGELKDWVAGSYEDFESIRDLILRHRTPDPAGHIRKGTVITPESMARHPSHASVLPLPESGAAGWIRWVVGILIGLATLAGAVYTILQYYMK